MMSPIMSIAVLTCALALSAVAGRLIAQPADTNPLQLETKIPLGNVTGRIDHMAVDLGRQRLFVAELGNESVGVVDLKDRKLLRRIAELKEPQDVAYVPATDMLYVS